LDGNECTNRRQRLPFQMRTPLGGGDEGRQEGYGSGCRICCLVFQTSFRQLLCVRGLGGSCVYVELNVLSVTDGYIIWRNCIDNWLCYCYWSGWTDDLSIANCSMFKLVCELAGRKVLHGPTKDHTIHDRITLINTKPTCI
jgi:hypothetical protein